MHPDINARIAQIRAEELMAEAERERLSRAHRKPGALRIAALRLAARGLRVEREIDFQPDYGAGR
jgi:hypothetical protein